MAKYCSGCCFDVVEGRDFFYIEEFNLKSFVEEWRKRNPGLWYPDICCIKEAKEKVNELYRDGRYHTPLEASHYMRGFDATCESLKKCKRKRSSFLCPVGFCCCS